VQFGKRAGLIAMLGNSTGILFHTIAVALGLSALVVYSPVVYSIIKWFGVVYLAYLAFRILRNRKPLDAASTLTDRNLAHIYKNGILVNLLNPKTFLLMLALLPQFVNSQTVHVSLQMGILGCIHIVMASVVLTILCLSVNKVSGSIQQSWLVQKLFRWTSATLLFVFAVKLALSN
jgi:threonine/homoserine/homoserine lactone efflux protein